MPDPQQQQSGPQPPPPGVSVVAEIKPDGTTVQVFKGTVQGAVEFVKETFFGLVDLVKVAVTVASRPVETIKAVSASIAGIASKIGTLAFGTDQERSEIYTDIKNRTDAIKEQLKKEFQQEYDKAKAEGREAEVVAKWATKGGLTIASMFVGAGAAAKAGQAAKASSTLSKAGNVLGGSTARCKAVFEKATQAAGNMAKAAKVKATAAAGGAARSIAGAAKMAAPAARAAVQSSGMLKAAARSVQQIAMKHGVRIKMRPTNPSALKWIKEGHPRKPEFLKNKTITHLDTMLGPPPSKDDIGLVGSFEPPPINRASIEAKFGKLTDEKWQELQSRHLQRLDEHAEFLHDLETKKGLKDKISVDSARGIIVDNRPGPTQGKGFTGDHDLFSIEKQKPDGSFELVTSKSDPDLYKAVTNDLKADPHVQAQHGAHTSWEADKGADLNPHETKIADKIYDSHKPGPKSEALTTFEPDGTVHETHYDGPRGSKPK